MAAIRKLKNDRYQVDFTLFGHRIRTHFYDEVEALNFQRKLLAKHARPTSTINAAVASYLKNETDKRKSYKSRISERLWFDEFQKFLLSIKIPGTFDLGVITQMHLEKFQTHLKENGSLSGRKLSNSSINRRFNTLEHFFKKCMEWRFIQEDPCRFVRRLPEKVNRRSKWREEDIEAVLNAPFIPVKEKELFQLLLWTGARLESLCLVREKDVDFDSMTITFHQRKGQGEENSYIIPISAGTVGLLQSRMSGQPDNFIFRYSNGKPKDPALISKHFSRYKKKLGRSHLTLHGLRHTFASRLHAQGASTETVRKFLGHSSARTTERYLHTEVDELRRWIA